MLYTKWGSRIMQKWDGQWEQLHPDRSRPYMQSYPKHTETHLLQSNRKNKHKHRNWGGTEGNDIVVGKCCIAFFGVTPERYA